MARSRQQKLARHIIAVLTIGLLLVMSLACAQGKKKSSYVYDPNAPESEFEHIHLWYISDKQDQFHLYATEGAMQKGKDLVLTSPQITGFDDKGGLRITGSAKEAAVNPENKGISLTGDVYVEDQQEDARLKAGELIWVEPKMEANTEVVFEQKNQKMETGSLILWPYRDEMVLDNQVRGYIIEEDAEN